MYSTLNIDDRYFLHIRDLSLWFQKTFLLFNFRKLWGSAWPSHLISSKNVLVDLGLGGRNCIPIQVLSFTGVGL